MGWGEAWGGGPWRAGKGGDGGGTREQCGSNKRCIGSPFCAPFKNLTTGLIWLVTRVGGWGEAWGGGPWRAGKGGRWGGGTREHCGSNKSAQNWSDLAGDEGGGMGGGVGRCTREQCGSALGPSGLIWLERGWGDGGRRGEVAHGGRARWEMGGSLKNLTTGLIWLVTKMGKWGDGGRRREVAHGGRARGEMGGAPDSSVGTTKGALVPLFWALLET